MSPIRARSLFLAFALAASPPARADEPKFTLDATTRDYDQIDLALDVDLDMEKGTVAGTATHKLGSLKDDLRVVRMHCEDMKVESATADGAACKVSQDDKLLTIELDRARKKDEPFTVAIRYAGKPTSGIWFFRPTPEHPEVPLQVWTQGEGTENRHWFPCYDEPDDRLTTSLRVTVPAGLQTLSNGRPKGTETVAGGRVAHTWVLDRPHPTYLVTLVAGTFHDHVRDAAGVEQHDLVPPEWKDWCDEVFGRTPDMMGFFQDYTGQKYPWGRYSQVTVWDFSWGGMENTGATTLNMRALHRDGIRPDYSADGLVAHELAHDWFGDLMTCRTWNHIWLNEGFASYFTDLWMGHSEGDDALAVAALEEQDGYMERLDLRAVSKRARPASRTDCGDVENHQYVKGASILHMLRGILGPDVFRDGIRAYVAANHDRAVVSEDLRAAFESVSGQNLAWFFDQWVYGFGVPELDVTSEWSAADKALVVKVAQTQTVSESMPLFRTPVDVAVTWPDGRVERRRMEIHRQSHEWRIAGPGEPKRFVLDPDGWLLARIRETKERAAWEEILGDAKTPVASRIRAVRALGGMGLDAIPALGRAAAGDPQHDVRAEACDALAATLFDPLPRSTISPLPPSPNLLAAALAASHLAAVAANDKDGRVRRSAVNALAVFPPRLAAPALVARIQTDTSVYVVADAAAALGRVRADGAFDVLVAALAKESHRDQIRHRVLDGLRELGDPRGADVARGYLDYAWGKGIQHQLRKAALDCMCALAPQAPETRAALLGLLGDPYFRMKQWSAEKCADLRMTEAVPALEAMAKDGIGPGVRDAAKRAIERLTGKKAEPEKK